MTHDSPVDLRGAVMYHCGPIALKKGDTWHLNGAGPTTSIREEPYQAEILRKFGLRAVIGKGGMGPKTLAALKEVGAVYLNAIGGAAQFYTQCITAVEGVDFLEFGTPEAMWHIRVKNFPAIVTMDAHATASTRRSTRNLPEPWRNRRTSDPLRILCGMLGSSLPWHQSLSSCQKVIVDPGGNPILITEDDAADLIGNAIAVSTDGFSVQAAEAVAVGGGGSLSKTSFDTVIVRDSSAGNYRYHYSIHYTLASYKLGDSLAFSYKMNGTMTLRACLRMIARQPACFSAISFLRTPSAS